MKKLVKFLSVMLCGMMIAMFFVSCSTLGSFFVPQYFSGTYGGGSYNGGNNSTPSSGKHVCGLCNGTGYMVKNDATDFGGTKWCETCKKNVSQSHYHAPCVSCGGKGMW